MHGRHSFGLFFGWVGFTFLKVAKNQLQAMQMTFFLFMPSILLLGFMFPFWTMPWGSLSIVKSELGV